jgi:hypothetical protein
VRGNFKYIWLELKFNFRQIPDYLIFGIYEKLQGEEGINKGWQARNCGDPGWTKVGRWVEVG